MVLQIYWGCCIPATPLGLKSFHKPPNAQWQAFCCVTHQICRDSKAVKLPSYWPWPLVHGSNGQGVKKICGEAGCMPHLATDSCWCKGKAFPGRQSCRARAAPASVGRSVKSHLPPPTRKCSHQHHTPRLHTRWSWALLGRCRLCLSLQLRGMVIRQVAIAMVPGCPNRASVFHSNITVFSYGWCSRCCNRHFFESWPTAAGSPDRHCRQLGCADLSWPSLESTNISSVDPHNNCLVGPGPMIDQACQKTCAWSSRIHTAAGKPAASCCPKPTPYHSLGARARLGCSNCLGSPLQGEHCCAPAALHRPGAGTLCCGMPVTAACSAHGPDRAAGASAQRLPRQEHRREFAAAQALSGGEADSALVHRLLGATQETSAAGAWAGRLGRDSWAAPAQQTLKHQMHVLLGPQRHYNAWLESWSYSY